MSKPQPVVVQKSTSLQNYVSENYEGESVFVENLPEVEDETMEETDESTVIVSSMTDDDYQVITESQLEEYNKAHTDNLFNIVMPDDQEDESVQVQIIQVTE